MHREMCSGLTTSALINVNCKLDKPVEWTDFSPNYIDHKPKQQLSEQQMQVVSDFNRRVLDVAAILRHGDDPLCPPTQTNSPLCEPSSTALPTTNA